MDPKNSLSADLQDALVATDGHNPSAISNTTAADDSIVRTVAATNHVPASTDEGVSSNTTTATYVSAATTLVTSGTSATTAIRQTCAVGASNDHNNSTVYNARRKRKSTTCGICGESGHNRQTCRDNLSGAPRVRINRVERSRPAHTTFIRKEPTDLTVEVFGTYKTKVTDRSRNHLSKVLENLDVMCDSKGVPSAFVTPAQMMILLLGNYWNILQERMVQKAFACMMI